MTYHSLRKLCLNVFFCNFLDNTKISPQFKTVDMGGHLHIFCDVNGPIKWTHNGGSLPSNAVVRDRYIYLIYIIMKNEGRYLCEGKSDNFYRWPKIRSPFAAVFTLRISS